MCVDCVEIGCVDMRIIQRVKYLQPHSRFKMMICLLISLSLILYSFFDLIPLPLNRDISFITRFATVLLLLVDAIDDGILSNFIASTTRLGISSPYPYHRLMMKRNRVVIVMSIIVVHDLL